MAKIFLGIDPGLTNTALVYFDEQGQYLGLEMIRVALTPKIKKAIPQKGARVNYKLRTIFTRVSGCLEQLMVETGVAPEDISVSLEGFWYKPAIKGKNGFRQANNYVFETVAGITATKCALMNKNISFVEIMPVQVKRIVNWLATGKTDAIDKKALAICIQQLMGVDVLTKILSEYAVGVHEHIIDAIAAVFAMIKKEEYSNYIKIPIKKRKKP